MASVLSLFSKVSREYADLYWVAVAPKTKTVTAVVVIDHPRWMGTSDKLTRIANITNANGVKQVGAGDELVCRPEDLVRLDQADYQDLKRYMGM